MRIIFTIIFITCHFFHFAQGSKNLDSLIKFVVPFKSKIVTDDLPCKNAVVNIYNADGFNYESDTNTILQTIEIGEEGILDIEIPSDEFYIIEIAKKGFIHKRFKINTLNVPKKNWNSKFEGFNIEAIELSIPIDGVNYHVFDYPLILIDFDYSLDNFYYNESYSDLALAAIKTIKESEKKQALVLKNKIILNKTIEESKVLKNRLFILSLVFGISFLILLGMLIILYRKGTRQKNKNESSI